MSLPDRPGAPHAQCAQCRRVFQDSAAFDLHQTESYRGKGRGTVVCRDPRRIRALVHVDGVWRRR